MLFWFILNSVLIGFLNALNFGETKRRRMVSKQVHSKNQPAEFDGFAVYDFGDV